MDKGIPMTMIAASSFDDIIAITVFGVFTSIGFEAYVDGAESLATHEIIIRNLLEVAAGVAFGCFMGGLMYLIRNV